MSFWKKKEITTQSTNEKDELKELAKARLEELSQEYEWITIDAYLVTSADMTSTNGRWKFELNRSTRIDGAEDFRTEQLHCYLTLDNALTFESPQFGQRYFKIRATVPSRINKKENRLTFRVMTMSELIHEQAWVDYYKLLVEPEAGSEESWITTPYPGRPVECAAVLTAKEIIPIEEVPYKEYQSYIDQSVFESESEYRLARDIETLKHLLKTKWCKITQGVFSEGFSRHLYEKAILATDPGSYYEKTIATYKRLTEAFAAVKDKRIGQYERILLFMQILDEK